MVQAIERYAADNHLTSSEVIDAFEKHNVYKKMLSEYEYLHQISIEEVFEYVNGLINGESCEMTLYHGSAFLFDNIDLSKSNNRRDFGIGFYTTVDKNQAFEWAEKIKSRGNMDKFYVYSYRFNFSDSLKIKRFDGITNEWLGFIKNNRVKGGVLHDYDIVEGPVVNDDMAGIVQLYIADVYTGEEALARLQYCRINNQVSFHTADAIKSLKFLRRSEYE
jgi:hypothetical protein